MIALNIPFQKIYRLPKSRWPAMKDKTINIPIHESDIIQTVQFLPRTPSEAGIVPVNLKRKKSYKNSHKSQYISVPKLFAALESLYKLGNKYYQFVPNIEHFHERCIENADTDLIYDEEVDECEEMVQTNSYKMSSFLVNDEIVNEDFEQDDDIEISELEEKEYQQNDLVKKWQIDYNQSTCFVNNYPELNVTDTVNNSVSIAPGEGKRPSNILEEVDWDLKSFPVLLPDGKNSLHTKRSIALSDHEYFIQRIMNRDFRFAINAAFIFSAVAYVETKQIQRNMGISFKRGTARNDGYGNVIYSLKDPYTV